MTPNLLSASTMNGTTVKNVQGEKIGEIKELMIDWRTGIVAYAVLSFGGFMGMGEKLFAIPVESFNFQPKDSDGHVTLSLNKQQLENAPGFDKDNWPEHPDYSFIDSVYTHYGYKPFSSRYSTMP